MALNTRAICESLQGFTGKVTSGANWYRPITLVDCKLCPSTGISTLGWFSGNGLVRAVGVSNYGPKQLVKIHNYLNARGVPLCSAQVQFSLLSMGKDQMEIKNICDSLGIRLIAYSPLGLGMLTGKYTSSRLPLGPRALLFRQILPGLEPLLHSLRDIAQRRRKTLPQVAINWCICNGAIPIPGVKTIKQAEENLGALGWRLSTDELLQLEYAARESPQKMIQNIFQTR